jgi:hypothetical protein
MKPPVFVLVPLSVALISACGPSHPSTPIGPTQSLVAARPAAEPDPQPQPEPTPPQYPSDGPGIIAYVVAHYPDRLAAGVSSDDRVANMQFLRDRIIEVGKCGGRDLGWNLKRGGPEISNDFITERTASGVIGHDIAFDYDNTSRPLQLYWGGGEFPSFKEYPQPSCS